MCVCVGIFGYELYQHIHVRSLAWGIPNDIIPQKTTSIRILNIQTNWIDASACPLSTRELFIYIHIGNVLFTGYKFDMRGENNKQEYYNILCFLLPQKWCVLLVVIDWNLHMCVGVVLFFFSFSLFLTHAPVQTSLRGKKINSFEVLPYLSFSHSKFDSHTTHIDISSCFVDITRVYRPYSCNWAASAWVIEPPNSICLW